MKFFNIDMHCAVISDVANIFKNLGHQVDDWSLSGHHWVMNKEKKIIPLNDGTIFTGCISNEACDVFYDTYKDQLNVYDGFIACYPANFAMLYEKWNKPIIIVNCIRYEHPNSKCEKEWHNFNDFLHRYDQKKLLWYVCNNKGDVWYTKYFANIDGTHIPSFCDYIGIKYTGNIDKFIIHDGSHIENIKSNCYSLGAIRTSDWKYKWETLYDHKGAIHNPYHNGSMSIFEHYTGNMPMFFPSKTFIKELFYKNQTLSQLTFFKIYNMPEPLHEPENPLNLSNPKILDKWIDTFDFYDEENMPYIQFFDNWDHLNTLLDTVDLKNISEKMKEYNIIRKNKIYNSWKKILNEISEKIK